MRKTFKSLPVGSLPYENEKFTTRMMVKWFEEVPYLPLLPKCSKKEYLVYRTLNNIPGLKVEDRKIRYYQNEKAINEAINLDKAYNNPTLDNLDPFKPDAFYLEKFFQVIKRIQPVNAVINFLGAFTVLQSFINIDNPETITEKVFRKIIIQALSVKALWIMKQMQDFSPDTIPIILFEDPLLSEFGKVKRDNESITRELLVGIYSKIIQKIHDNSGLVCVQCFGKCDWSILIESGVDMISFGAYSNPNNLTIMPKVINNFLAKGGIINWGIVPTKSERALQAMNSDKLYDKLENTIEDLIRSGVNGNLVYDKSTVSVQGNLDRLDLFFAEKALIISQKVAEKLMKHSDSLQ